VPDPENVSSPLPVTPNDLNATDPLPVKVSAPFPVAANGESATVPEPIIPALWLPDPVTASGDNEDDPDPVKVSTPPPIAAKDLSAAVPLPVNVSRPLPDAARDLTATEPLPLKVSVPEPDADSDFRATLPLPVIDGAVTLPEPVATSDESVELPVPVTPPPPLAPRTTNAAPTVFQFASELVHTSEIETVVDVELARVATASAPPVEFALSLKSAGIVHPDAIVRYGAAALVPVSQWRTKNVRSSTVGADASVSVSAPSVARDPLVTSPSTVPDSLSSSKTATLQM